MNAVTDGNTRGGGMNRWTDSVEVTAFGSPVQLRLFFEPGTVFRLTAEICGDDSFADSDEEVTPVPALERDTDDAPE